MSAHNAPIILLAHHLNVHAFFHFELLFRVVIDRVEIIKHLGPAERLFVLARLLAVLIFAVVANCDELRSRARLANESADVGDGEPGRLNYNIYEGGKSNR